MTHYIDTPEFRDDCPRAAYYFKLQTMAVSMDTPSAIREPAVRKWCAENNNPQPVRLENEK